MAVCLTPRPVHSQGRVHSRATSEVLAQEEEEEEKGEEGKGE